jgi:hypothetical protein
MAQKVARKKESDRLEAAEIKATRLIGKRLRGVDIFGDSYSFIFA